MKHSTRKRIETDDIKTAMREMVIDIFQEMILIIKETAGYPNKVMSLEQIEIWLSSVKKELEIKWQLNVVK